jgi:hypothetical protein
MPDDQQPKRQPGRPRKGFVKVLVSLEPAQASHLATVAMIRGAIEGRKGDVSALMREIIEESKYLKDLGRDVKLALEAINSSPLAMKKMKEVTARHKGSKPRAELVEPALRAAYIEALNDNASQPLLAKGWLLLHIEKRLRADAAKAVHDARERAGFTPSGLANRAGLPLKKVEAAENGYIDGEIATKLARPLGVKPEDLCPRDLWGRPKK